MIIFKVFIRSKIDYGSTCKTLIKKLKVVQHNSLKIVVGALRSTPITALRCESMICSVQDRISENTIKYFFRAYFRKNDNSIKMRILPERIYHLVIDYD